MQRPTTVLLILLSVAVGCAGRMSVAPLREDPALLAGEPFAEVRGANYSGVIIPEERIADMNYFFGEWEGFWTPTESDIESLENGLLEALEEIDCNPYIRQHLDTYRRQYVGVIVGKDRRVLVNAFPAPDEGFDSKYYWRHQFVFVEDGGYHYWRIQFDPASGRYDQFDQNGVA